MALFFFPSKMFTFVFICSKLQLKSQDEFAIFQWWIVYKHLYPNLKIPVLSNQCQCKIAFATCNFCEKTPFREIKRIDFSRIPLWNWGQGCFPISVHLTKAAKVWIVFSILNRALSWAITSFGNKFCLKMRSKLIKASNNRFYDKFMQLEIGLLSKVFPFIFMCDYTYILILKGIVSSDQ